MLASAVLNRSFQSLLRRFASWRPNRVPAQLALHKRQISWICTPVFMAFMGHRHCGVNRTGFAGGS